MNHREEFGSIFFTPSISYLYTSIRSPLELKRSERFESQYKKFLHSQIRLKLWPTSDNICLDYFSNSVSFLGLFTVHFYKFAEKLSIKKTTAGDIHMFMHFLLWICAGTQISIFICRSIKFISVIWLFFKNMCYLNWAKHRNLDIFNCFFTVFPEFIKHNFRRFKKNHWALEPVPLKSIKVLRIYLNRELFISITDFGISW